MSLDQAVTAMAAAANDELVGLVIRWNGDDSKVRTIWSEPGKTAAHQANPQGNQRTARMFRLNDDRQPEAGIRSALPVADPTGYHAEEIMIACWADLIGAVGLTEGQIRSIDLVLSKSPCYGEAGSSVLIIESATGASADRYQQSCSMKLYQFCASRSNVRFRISYITLAGAHAGTYALDSVGKAGGIRSLMTDEERKLEPVRKKVADLQSDRNAKEAQRAAAYTKLETLKKQKDDEKIALEEREKIPAQLGAIGKEISKLGGALGKLNAPADKARKDARLVSLAQAQMGIAKLQSLINVDVVRRGYMQSNPDFRGRAAAR